MEMAENFFFFEEQQNVINFILENEGDYEGYFCKL